MAQVEMYAAKANSPATELTAALTDIATTVSVLDASRLPDAPNIATIGVDESAETIKYTGKSGNDLTGVTRGFSGTVAKAWGIGVGVARYFTAYDADALRENVADVNTQLAENAYSITAAGCTKNDTGDCGVILNALTGKNYIYIPEGTFRFTTGFIIDNDHTTVILHPKAKIHVIGNIDAILISGNNCFVSGGEIYSDGTTFGNGRYGIRVSGDNCKVENIYIHDISYTAVSNEGDDNEFLRIKAEHCGWDLAQNVNAKRAKWVYCKAIRTGRHGFSTDVSEDIWFEECYVEDLGTPSLAEGQDTYHFENCDGGGIKNCKSKFTSANPYVLTAGVASASVRLGVRASNSKQISVDGLKIDIDSGFIPVDLARLFNWVYCESVVSSPEILKMKNVIVNNSSNFLTKAYLGAYVDLELKDCIFKGYVGAKQESVAGILTKIEDCIIDGLDKTYYFYDHPFSTFGFEAINNRISNSKGLINGGQLINSLIEKNRFISCYDAVILGRYSAIGAKNTIVRQNYIKNIDNTAIQGSFGATAQDLKIIDNYFGGTINKLFVGESGTCNALWKNNNAETGLVVTTLVTGSVTAILSDMTSNYDVVRDGATVRPANPDTSGVTLAALETEVNELKAAMRIARIIF